MLVLADRTLVITASPLRTSQPWNLNSCHRRFSLSHLEVRHLEVRHTCLVPLARPLYKCTSGRHLIRNTSLNKNTSHYQGHNPHVRVGFSSTRTLSPFACHQIISLTRSFSSSATTTTVRRPLSNSPTPRAGLTALPSAIARRAEESTFGMWTMIRVNL